ncbi:serpin B [Actinocrispum wychmicini]|uniref:Serpin B n=1 Tax=Actinocrispum wychmicini TaxID=1213861 RepID=A0A4R2J0I5_9PSEU|nr:serpin B [Actinocrispum wychmicini]
MVWSPFSVASALALAARGAAGATRDELVALLLGDKGAQVEDLIRVLGAAEDVVRAGSSGEQPEIAVSNTFWADEIIPVRPEFAEALTDMPSGAVRSAPFQQDPDGARDLINKDVARTTHDLIPELLPDGAICPDTVAALVNALYLKVAWLGKFDETATRPRDFHTPTGTKQVPTMFVRGERENFGYAKVPGWQAVRIHTVGQVDAFVLLPDGKLPDVDADTLGRLLAAPGRHPVNLRLPKLSLKLQAPLTDVLQRLGVATMFTNDAEFPGISAAPLAVQAVLHETVLKMDEQGFEGAAATAVMMRLLSFSPQRPVEVTVDRPFLVVIRHTRTGVIYFSGRVADPS